MRINKWCVVSFRMEGDGTKLDPIKPDRAFKSPQDVREEMAIAKSHAQTYYTIADNEKRALTEHELADVQRQLDYHTTLKAEHLPRAEQYQQIQQEDAKQQLANTARELRVGNKLSGSAFPITGGGYHGGAVPRVMSTNLKGFRSCRFAGGAAEAEEAAVDCGMWMRAVTGGDAEAKEHVRTREHLQISYDSVQASRGQSMVQETGTDNVGGYLVPTILSQAIIDVRDQWGIIPQNCQNYAMQSEKDNINKRLTGLTIYKPGETTAITPSDKTWGQLLLDATDAYTLTYLSHKLLRGSIVSAADQVVNEIGYAFAKQIDLEGFLGDGVAGTPYYGITGLIPGIGTAGHTTTAPNDWALITNAVIGELIGLLPSRFHRGAKFYCSRVFYATVIEPILEGRAASKGDMGAMSPRELKGYPIVFSENMPQAYAISTLPLIFGSLEDSMILGSREGVGVAFSEDHRFDFDQLSIRGRMAWDINFHEPGDDSTTVGGMVAIKTAAI